MSRNPQNFKNHTRYIPLFHFVCGGFLVVYFFYSVFNLWRAHSVDHFFQIMLAFALLLLFWYVRVFPTTAQDRIIRLEMQLRLQALAPELMPRFDRFGIKQLAALRFASDAELPDLSRRVLDGKLVKSSDIKQQISDWRPDYVRV